MPQGFPTFGIGDGTLKLVKTGLAVDSVPMVDGIQRVEKFAVGLDPLARLLGDAAEIELVERLDRMPVEGEGREAGGHGRRVRRGARKTCIGGRFCRFQYAAS